jgi:hypothetical protein
MSDNPLAPPSNAPMAGGMPLPGPSDGAPGAPDPGTTMGDSRVRNRGEKQQTPFDQFHQNLDITKKQYENNVKAFKVVDHVRKELDDLMKMGDIIRPEDVIQAAGRLVGHGLGAENLAQLLSDMPTLGGQGLASWIRMHDMTMRATESKLAAETDLYRHRMAIAGFKSLAAIHAEDRIKEGVGAAMNSMGDLGPGAGGAGGPGMTPGNGGMAPGGGSALGPTQAPDEGQGQG